MLSHILREIDGNFESKVYCYINGNELNKLDQVCPWKLYSPCTFQAQWNLDLKHNSRAKALYDTQTTGQTQYDFTLHNLILKILGYQINNVHQLLYHLVNTFKNKPNKDQISAQAWFY